MIRVVAIRGGGGGGGAQIWFGQGCPGGALKPIPMFRDTFVENETHV